MEAQQQEAHGSRLAAKLSALISRLYETRNGLHRVEGILHGGPPEAKQVGSAPSPGDVQSTVREGHNILDEIETSLRRVVVSLGLEADDQNQAAPSAYGPPPVNGGALAGSHARR